MLNRSDLLDQPSDRVALKDEHLVYRACSMAFAQSVGRTSPDEIIGKTDFDLFPGPVAREQMALDSQTIYSAQADISAINLGSVRAANQRNRQPADSPAGKAADGSAASQAGKQAMIVRTPVLASDNQVRGIDIRLLGGPTISAPRSAVTIDYQTLVNSGIQGSLIIARQAVLFANDNAAKVLGFSNAQALIDNGQVSDLFSDAARQHITDVAVSNLRGGGDAPAHRTTLSATTRDGSTVRLIAHITHVQWGASRAILLSFVDVAIPVDTAALQSSGLASIPGAESPSGYAEAYAEPRVAMVPGTDNQPAGADTLDELQKLRRSEQRFRHYTKAAADFYWELDAKLMFRVISADLKAVLGVPGDYLIGRTHTQLLDHPANVNDPQHWAEHLRLLVDHKPFRDFEFRWSVGGDTRVIRYSGIPVFNQSKQFLGYRGVGCDVTASVRQAETTAYHANHDALTGLVNRRHFENQVNTALEASRLNRQAHALCFMDLDSFKIVNDTCGHQAGDELLRQLAQLFDSLVRKSDLLARLGGDEFGVLLYKCSVAEALKLANQIRHEVENFQFLWEGKRFTVGVSVGLVVVDDRWDSIDSVFSAADSACYIAKNEGRNRVVVYREGEGNNSNRKVATQWVEEINTALEADRLRLACQKIQPLHNQPDGLRFEMLLRLELPNGELISPSAFLPSAERYGLIAALDQRAIQLTLAWLNANAQLQHSIRHVSINLSSASFTDADFAGQLIQMIDDSGIEPAKLCFELTETATIANLSKASAFMHKLAERGCRFSIDDFGSGLSSFAYLRKLPIDFLKIDGLLVKDILDDPTDYTLVKAINEISKSLGKRTVAEFIESPRLLNAVRDIGIDFAQGYHIGEPELIVAS